MNDAKSDRPAGGGPVTSCGHLGGLSGTPGGHVGVAELADAHG
ncbi:MAG: hypothetical protein QOG53_2672 [Frankiales bacterium]|nr:hypothetical protein [Frankiales bacterium]